MQTTTNLQLDKFIKALPVINLFVILPVAFISQRLDDYLPLLCCIIFGFATLSVLSAIYKIETTKRNKLINPKKYLILSVITALIVFNGSYFGSVFFGWI